MVIQKKYMKENTLGGKKKPESPNCDDFKE